MALYGEPKRACDPPESYSCLHMVNPIMVPMTFRGMQMLHRLWAGDTRNPVSVPPLPEYSRRDGDGVTELLEVMPGAVLRRLGLPFKGYKGGAKAGENRRRIVSELQKRASPIAFNFDEFEDVALKSHDALDSVVAAVAAALWATGTRPVSPAARGRGGGLRPHSFGGGLVVRAGRAKGLRERGHSVQAGSYKVHFAPAAPRRGWGRPSPPAPLLEGEGRRTAAHSALALVEVPAYAGTTAWGKPAHAIAVLVGH